MVETPRLNSHRCIFLGGVAGLTYAFNEPDEGVAAAMRKPSRHLPGFWIDHWSYPPLMARCCASKLPVIDASQRFRHRINAVKRLILGVTSMAHSTASHGGDGHAIHGSR